MSGADKSETDKAMMMLKVLVLRIIEANATRELLDESAFLDAQKTSPDILKVLNHAHHSNKAKFEHAYVEPMKIESLQAFEAHIRNSGIEETIHLTNVAIFIMEREINAITKRVVEEHSK